MGKTVYVDVHCGIIHNIKILEISDIANTIGIVKQILVFQHIETL